MNNKDEVFEYLVEQLRQRVGKFNVVAEIHKMSIDRSRTGRSGYSDEENAIIDAYLDRDSDSKQIIHNLKQHIVAKDDRIRALENRLRRAREEVEELRGTIEHMDKVFKLTTARSEECEHDYRLVACSGDLKQCTKCGVAKPETEPSDGWVENPGRKAFPAPGDCEV
ncbi:TPA: hypothetical protein ACIAM1_002356 [Salmonella enterica subsp. enterica serovar Chester]